MRCLCYAKFLSNGAIPSGEFCAHVRTIWSCIEDTPKTIIKSSNRFLPHNRYFPISIVFITDCQSVEQLTSDLETMPGAGISNIEVFPVQEMIESQ
jgi:hypothetical protein